MLFQAFQLLDTITIFNDKNTVEKHLFFLISVSHQWCDLFHQLLHSYTRHIERGSRGERDIVPSTQVVRPRTCSLRQVRVSG
jgi:hypothetical protein